MRSLINSSLCLTSLPHCCLLLQEDGESLWTPSGINTTSVSGRCQMCLSHLSLSLRNWNVCILIRSLGIFQNKILTIPDHFKAKFRDALQIVVWFCGTDFTQYSCLGIISKMSIYIWTIPMAVKHRISQLHSPWGNEWFMNRCSIHTYV